TLFRSVRYFRSSLPAVSLSFQHLSASPTAKTPVDESTATTFELICDGADESTRRQGIQTGAEPESRATFWVIGLAAAGDADATAGTVHSWKGPPCCTGAKNAIVLPSGENAGAAAICPVTRTDSWPTSPVPVSMLARTSSVD